MSVPTISSAPAGPTPTTLSGVGDIYWREAVLCVPAMPLMMLAGALTGDITTAAIAAGAAFSVGFGAARDLRGRRWGAMLAAMLSMSAATLIGSLSGGVPWLAPIVAATAGAACAVLAMYDEDMWWIALQAVIALLVAQYYPGDAVEALRRAVIVLGGGAVQIACVVALVRVMPAARARLPRGAAPQHPGNWAVAMHAVRAALCVAGSLLIARHWGLANSYWAPMTAMLILKPGLRDTWARGGQRIFGTLAGCVGATVFVVAVGTQTWVMLPVLALTTGFAFAVQKGHYAVLTTAITATVVLLLALAHGAALANAEHRVIATLLGGGCALAVAWIAPRRPRWRRRLVDRVGR